MSFFPKASKVSKFVFKNGRQKVPPWKKRQNVSPYGYLHTQRQQSTGHLSISPSGSKQHNSCQQQPSKMEMKGSGHKMVKKERKSHLLWVFSRASFKSPILNEYGWLSIRVCKLYSLDGVNSILIVSISVRSGGGPELHRINSTSFICSSQTELTSACVCGL